MLAYFEYDISKCWRSLKTPEIYHAYMFMFVLQSLSRSNNIVLVDWTHFTSDYK